MAAYHQALLTVHITCVIGSGVLFVLRHVLNLMHVNWRKSRALIIMPHVIDTLLLASAIALMFAIKQYPFINSWLTMKLFLLVAYILLGTIALKRGRTQGVRRVAFLSAATVFAFMITVAQTHSAFGILSRL
ncbi:MAG TPA: SirB2 family protein [Steroidobacteraceae bacterium]|nr:SirB2 family protein [Steroidobacteraceae bacterium]